MRAGRWSWEGQAKGCNLGPEEEGGRGGRRGGRGGRRGGGGGRRGGRGGRRGGRGGRGK